jgi:phage-related minor tail protein
LRIKEENLKHEFEIELKELQRTLISSQHSAVETLNQRQEELESALKLLERKKVELIEMIEKLKKELEEQQKSNERITEANILQKSIISVQEKELCDLEVSIPEDQKKFAGEVQSLKNEITKEDQQHQMELKRQRENLELEK